MQQIFWPASLWVLKRLKKFLLTVDEMFVSKHNLQHGIWVQGMPIGTAYIGVRSRFCDSFCDLWTAFEYLNALFSFHVQNRLIILKVYIALRFDASDCTKNVRLILLNLIVKIVPIILIIELRAIDHALNVGSSAILLRATVVWFSCRRLRLWALTTRGEMCIWRIVHHLHPIMRIYLFWEEAAWKSLVVPSILFHVSIYNWWLVHCRGSSETSILLCGSRCYYLSVMMWFLIKRHRNEGFIWLHGKCTVIHLL